MGRRKPRLTLPPGDSGEFILTPAIARHTHSVVSDLERLVRKRSISLGVDLWFQLTVVSTGMKVTWGPGSEVIVEDNDTDDIVRKSIMIADGKPVDFNSLVMLAGNATA